MKANTKANEESLFILGFPFPFLLFSEVASHQKAQAGFKFTEDLTVISDSLRPQPPKCSDYTCELPSLSYDVCLIGLNLM